MRDRSSLSRRLALIAAVAWMTMSCGTVNSRLAPTAEAIVSGTTVPDVHIDTTADPFAVSLGRARWRTRIEQTGKHDFWNDIANLDSAGAERDAVDVDERTFAMALRHLMASDPEKAAIVFHVLHRTAADPVVRAQSRVGLNMALTWSSDWSSIASLEHDPDSLSVSSGDPLALNAAVERWAHAFAQVPPPSIEISEKPLVIPLRRSRIGTPIARVLINGRPHDFWLDTGASMTVLSTDVAVEAGIHLVATDTLALGVVGGGIDARAVLVDSLSMGGFTARGMTAAVVNAGMLRLDPAMEDRNGTPVPIDGVIGCDLLRHMDLIIDTGAGTISIAKPRRDTRTERRARNLFWLGFPVVRLVTHDGRSLLFGLDTGAQSSYVTLSLLRKLPRTHVAARRGRLGGLGGETEQTQWVASSLAVSDGAYAIRLRNTPVGPEHRWSFVNVDGMIGSDIALGTRLHLDFENGVFDVRPSAVVAPGR